jgi:hypothetical protein
MCCSRPIFPHECACPSGQVCSINFCVHP